MTIEQYLSGKVDFYLSEATIAGILVDRRVAPGSEVCIVTERQRDLCLADLYRFVAASSTTSSGELESDSGWQRQRASKNVYDRNGLLKMARRLYAKWGEPLDDDMGGGTIVMKPIY